MQGKPIDVAPVVAAARQAFEEFCAELHAYTGAPSEDSCANRNFCKYATHMVQGGNSAEHDELPIPAYVAALAPLAKKRALAQMRLSGAPIQTNLQRGASAVLAVPYSQRLCPRGCAAAVDTEQHVWIGGRRYRGNKLPAAGRNRK
jgi:hypothetical protein